MNIYKKIINSINKIYKKQKLIISDSQDVSIYNTINPKYNKIIIFLTPGHTDKTPGKHSPDCRLYEWKYNRQLLSLIEKKLDKIGLQHWNSHPEDSWVDKAHSNDNKDLQLRV